MARNTNYPYDPYAGEVPMQAVEDVMTVGSIAREVTNPINWLLWKYQYDPRTYSLSKGLSVPFGKTMAKYGFGNTVSMMPDIWKVNTVGKGFLGTVKGTHKTLKNIGGSFYWGKDYFSDDWLKNAKLDRAKAQSTLKNIARTDRRFKRQELLLLKNSLRPRPVLNPYETIKLNKRERLLKSSIAKYTEASAARDATKTAAFKTISDANFKIGARTLLKWGVLAPLKVFAGVGAITTAWDVSKMVGEPIGRYLVENANRVGTAWQNRFAPEMGGKIAMSYMATGAATERQRAIEGISRSYINGRSALGNEAQLLHS